MSAITVDPGKASRVSVGFTITVLSAFTSDSTSAFGQAMTDIDGEPRSWGREEYDFGTISVGATYPINSHSETLSMRYGSQSTQAMFNAAHPYREHCVVGNEFIATYSPDSPRGSVKVAFFGRGGQNLPQAFTSQAQYSTVFSGVKGQQSAKFRLGRSMPDRFVNYLVGEPAPTDGYNPIFDGCVVCIYVNNAVGGQMPYSPEPPGGTTLGTLRIEWALDLFEPVTSKVTKYLRTWALAGCPIPLDPMTGGDVPGVYTHTRNLVGVPDSDTYDKDTWPPRATAYCPPVRSGKDRCMRDTYSPCFIGQSEIPTASRLMECMIRAGTLGLTGWAPVMGFVESPTVHGHVRSGDVTTRATLTAYAVRDIDGVTYVAGTDIPGLPFTPAPARLPLGSLASASTPVPGATCSFTADSDEARSCANDGQGNFTTDLVGGLVAASTTTWTGLILLNVIPDKTPTPAVTRKPGYIVGCQITMWRTASLDGAGAESVLVGGYTLSSGSVGPTGTELPLATGLQIRKTSPPDRQYRALPYDIQQRIAAATTPKFYVTVGGLQSGVKGISLADVLSFAGSMLSKTRTGGPGEYLGGETGDWPTIPGTRAGKTLIGADVSTVPVVAGVNSTNCANFPIFPLSFHFALSPDNTPVSRRFVTVGIRVSVLINAAVVTSSQLVDDVSFVVMGQLQSACTLVNPAKDPRLALLLGMPTIDPGPNTTQRTEAVPITRLCSTVKPVITATYKYRNAQGTTVVAEVPGQGIASAVLRLETVTSVTLAIPSQLPASEATMLDRSRWVDVGAGTEVFHIFAYAIQSVARVTANGEQPLTLAFIPGPPEIFGNYDSDGYLQDARVTDENTSWLYVERFDVDVGSGERSGWTTK